MVSESRVSYMLEKHSTPDVTKSLIPLWMSRRCLINDQQLQNSQQLQQSALISCSCSRLSVKHLCFKSRSPLHNLHPRAHSEGEKSLLGQVFSEIVVQENWRTFAMPLTAHFRNGLLLLPSQHII